jgi:6,7-dimethyl-8-ribityllumazine synthase
MPTIFEGKPAASGGRFALIVARFNQSITSRLLEGAIETLRQRGVADGSIDVFWVPGAFEIPTVAGRLARGGKHAAILCLGAVIKGETTHDEHINRAVSLSLAELGATAGVPVLFGVLTCNRRSPEVAARRARAARTSPAAGSATRAPNAPKPLWKWSIY